MKTKDIEQRLKLLVKLCNETEPTLDDIKSIREDAEAVTGAVDELFTDDMIKARYIYIKVRDGDVDGSEDVIQVMREANRIWKQRNLIKEVGWKQFYSVEGTVIDFLRQRQKINAIKFYRQSKLDKGEECGLKEAKEYVDALERKHSMGN